MSSPLTIGGVPVDVVRKDIKNIHLSVHPPTGKVRVAAPSRMNLDTIRVFTIAKLPWIRRQQIRFSQQERETPREYIERESHYVWGRRYLLKVIEAQSPPAVELKHNSLFLQVRPDTELPKRHAILEEWYREQVKQTAPALIAKWEKLIGVKASRVFVQRMKTKWGSCNPRAGNIRLNTDLAKKPRECLEYLIVHELLHLIEPTHNAHFFELMKKFMPKWKTCREHLNRLPIRQEKWEY